MTLATRSSMLLAVTAWVVTSATLADSTPAPAQDAAKSPAVHQETRTQPPAEWQPRRTLPPLSRASLTRNGYTSVQVNVDEFGDNIVGDLGNDLVALLPIQTLTLDGEVEEDLEVDLSIGTVDSTGIVDEVGEAPTPEGLVFDTTLLRETEIATLTGDPGADVSPVDPNPVVDPILGRVMGLMGGLDVRSDPPIPEQVDRGAEHGADRFVRGHDALLDAENLSRLG